MAKILVTGGCGYIGSHTLVELINHGFEVVSVDNNSRSRIEALDGVEAITKINVKNYKVDACDLKSLQSVFKENEIAGIIHFAAYKSVGESVGHPLVYYRNNISSLVNILDCCIEFNVPNFVFSSSCSVYGNVQKLPVTEDTPLGEAESPYARTKQMGEQIILDFSKACKVNNVLLRYFNPVGAHHSASIGEWPIDPPNNLVPVITETAAGIRKSMTVFGGDYDTRDGSCIRDYIHVVDIANAHIRALQYMIEGRNSSNFEIFNLGTGNGVSVFEAIHAFEKVSGQKLNYNVGDKRPGDVVQIYADNQKAREKLGWTPKFGIDSMMETAWNWQRQLKEHPVNV